MSTIADYSVFTKAFLASNNVDFSKPYGNWGENGALKAFAVVPLSLDHTLTPREAMNFDWSKVGPNAGMRDSISCQDADGNFIGNIVRVQPGVREGSIRLVAKVAVTAPKEEDVADIKVNTFVLLRTDASTSADLPIAVATISAGYMLHKHLAIGNDPLDDVENANYVSFTINHLNGYTSVDFNPDAYATYDDVANALSRGIDGLHIAFNSNTGDIILSDSKGNVIDQANLHLDLSADTIIAEGEEGYKYVKTDRNQDVHSAKAFMAPSPGENGSYTSAFGSSEAVPYNTNSASLVRYEHSLSEVCNGIRVRWNGSGQEPHDEIFYVFLKDGDGTEGTENGKKYLAWNSYQRSNSELTQGDPKLFHTASGAPIEVTGDSAIYLGNPDFNDIKPVYNHDVFVHTVGNSSLGDWDKCFQLMGFHDGDDIPLGTDLPALMQALSNGNGYLDPEAWIHGENADNASKVVAQRENAKQEMVAYNSRRPALDVDRNNGTIIDSTGLDVRSGRITLGCGNLTKAGVYGIQMSGSSESLDFTISRSSGEVQFDENGHATGLTSSTLLSIEAGSYISGAPTCLILAKVTRKPKEGEVDPLEGSPVLTPVRMTAGFSVEQSYDALSGLSLTLNDGRGNISAVFTPKGYKYNPAIIEVQAIYMHPAAQNETVPAQQMHTYIGSWLGEPQPKCSFLCNKIEEWMTAIDLPNPIQGVGENNPKDENVKLYVVIRVY